VATFGFHLASLEIRQHSAVHRAAESALADGAPSGRLVPGVTAAEVVETFRTVAAAQARFGPSAAGSYVISFTAEPADVGPGAAPADVGGSPLSRRRAHCSRTRPRSKQPARSSTASWATRPIAATSATAATARR
jgi:hypothetical protein